MNSQTSSNVRQCTGTDRCRCQTCQRVRAYDNVHRSIQMLRKSLNALKANDAPTNETRKVEAALSALGA